MQPENDPGDKGACHKMGHTELCFPDWFLWGAATAAHQVEGHNVNNDWWAWEQAGGHIRNGDRSGAACDWWNRAEADFDLARGLGQNSHRLSLEWSRLEPRPGVNGMARPANAIGRC